MRLGAGRLNFRSLVTVMVITSVFLLLLVIDRQIVRLNGDMYNQDFFSLWASGRGLLEGANLYDPEAWADLHARYGSSWLENIVFIYPLPVAFLFLPFSLLPLPLAATAWELASQVMLIVSIVALFVGLQDRRLSLVLLPLVFFSRPAMVIFINGQLSAVWPFSLSLFYLFVRRGQYTAAASVLVLLLLKPSIPLFILPVALVWLLTCRAWKGLFAFATLSAAVWGLSLVVEPGWVGRWSVFALAKGSHFATFIPTFWGLSYDLLATRFPGTMWLVALAVVSGLSVALCMWWLIHSDDIWPPALWLACAVCLSLLVSPYAWNYDQVLLLFPLGVILAMSDRMDGWRRMLTQAGAIGVMGILPYVLLAVAGQRGVDTLSALVPLAMLLLLIGTTRWGTVCHGWARSNPQPGLCVRR